MNVAKSHDNLLMLAAVAATAVLCVSGMYLVMGSGSNGDSIDITVPSGTMDGIAPLLEEFGTYSRAGVRVSAADAPSFAGGADVVVTNAPIEQDGIESVEIVISGMTLYANFVPGQKGTTDIFINWLSSRYAPDVPEG